MNWVRASLAALIVPLIGLSSSRVDACGGTFCDSGPTAMPVDQTGENILFMHDGTHVEAHIQIQYQGDPERFAWVIPVQALPEISVGSQPLFDALLAGTVPAFGFTTSVDTCDIGRENSGGAFDSAGSGGSGGAGGAMPGSGPQVVQRGTVGAFDYVTLQGGTALEVSDWLSTNGYQNIDTAPGILEQYVLQNHLFVAIKLSGGAGVDEIHPLVIRYAGSEPCVPLKLTAVAAVQDMGIRTFFLGKGRWVPTNYKHVVPNWVRLDWANQGANYNELISKAADSPVADGQAFVTEYAGTSSVVQTGNLHNPAWNPSAFVSIAPVQVVDELSVQSLVSCSSFECSYFHPLIQSLLAEYLPRPVGMTEAEFYSCLSCNEAQIDLTKWNGAAFAQDFDERIVQPGLHALTLLSQSPYLTRMFTTISPVEMSLDPMFHERADLPEVPLPTMANRRITCTGQDVYELPDGREVAIETGTTTWPSFSEEMPWAERIEEFPESGGNVELVDNSQKIQSQLEEHNDSEGWPPESASGGCVCSVPAGGRSSDLALLAVLAALGIARRRRRTR